MIADQSILHLSECYWYPNEAKIFSLLTLTTAKLLEEFKCVQK